jgi:hypothetical protein
MTAFMMRRLMRRASLVINALKHGFPSGDEGESLVKYDAQDSGWQLSVSDNGSGPKEAAACPYIRPWHEHRRGTSPSTQHHGPQIWGAQGTTVSIIASAATA